MLNYFSNSLFLTPRHFGECFKCVLQSAGISAGNKQKKSDKKPKPLNFDFINAPEKVDWLLTDASMDSWTPFLGSNPVPESIRQDWAAAFTSLTASKSGQAMF